jgi:HEAT repeat protein
LKKHTNQTGASRPIVLVAVLVVAAAVVGVFYFRPGPQTISPDQTPVANTDQSLAKDGSKSKPAPATVGTPNEQGAAVKVVSAREIHDFVQILKDAARPVSEKRAAVATLAGSGSPDAIAALIEAMRGAPDDLRAVIAEGLGNCTSPDCFKALVGLVGDASPAVAEAAIRGLGKQGTAEAAATLSQLLGDAQQPGNLRVEAALALGEVSQPGVTDALTQAVKQTGDEDLAAAAMRALGSRNFTETESFFQDYLRSRDVTTENRVAAIEALANAQGDPTALLVSLAADPESDVRVAAASALTSTEVTGNAGAQLLALAQAETDPDVRLRLYQAMENQESFDPKAALALVQGEKDPSARIAGMDMLARELRDHPSPDLQAFFSQTAIPELKQMALNGETFDDRQQAIIALARSQSPEALAAVQDVARQIAARQAASSAPKPQPPGNLPPTGPGR